AWRYRNNSSISNNGGWENATSYLERAIPAVKGELTVGDASTSGDVFDSVLLRGVQLNSDTDMLPEQMNGFAPFVRGFAKSYATVTVRDNGYVIYQRQVPPGPFAISDLSSVSSGGKLDVTVKEADGSETHNIISYSSVPQLVRPGQFKYDIALGKYNVSEFKNSRDPDLIQVALAWGLPWDLTIYGGDQHNVSFNAYSGGVGLDLHRAGGVALDITHSESSADKWGRSSRGNMARLTYRNDLASLGSQVELDSRFYSGNYKSFSDYLSEDGT
ncbi:fimbria/pilus outer membrane usher protein, partial [Enterobacter cloacae complex sp. P4RS]|uniref:fimbria/pilus outer membrane usher protein n=1 Tax=Enterobacter cloacae complex sp. P4RS TaxID=2779590 RepID=UPI0018741A3C